MELTTLIYRNLYQISYRELRYFTFDIRDFSAFQVDLFMPISDDIQLYDTPHPLSVIS
jgi:hypothetical protein